MINRTEKTHVQPTLTIYLGGSGMACGGEFKKMLRTLGPRERDLIEDFYIDSQEPANLDHHRVRHYYYTDLHVFNGPIYQEFQQGRFPENLGMNPVVNSSDGCGVTRIFGAASLVHCRDDFLELIAGAVRRLKERRRTGQTPQVFLTASSCGGTGAGMILDAAALIRQYFKHEVGESPRIFFFLIGPDAFFEDSTMNIKADQKERMKASSYALLKELHHFSRGNPFRTSYRLRDAVVEIGNVSDDDRLFDWVYYVDGRSEQGMATRSQRDLAWIVAESQFHLCVTEVGRKVVESIPNQREERLREYASNFVHPDRRAGLDKSTREMLEVSSRRTFLASFSVRNIRFPARELEAVYVSEWVLESLLAILRRPGRDAGGGLLEEFDRVLGFDGERCHEGGLLWEIGLHERAVPARAEGSAQRDFPEGKYSASDLDQLVGQGENFLVAAERQLDRLEGFASESPTMPGGEGDEEADGSLGTWRVAWRDSFERVVAKRLWNLALDPVEGKGMEWLDGFLERAAAVLDTLSRKPLQGSDHGELRDRLAGAKNGLASLRKRRDKENAAWLLQIKRLMVRWSGGPKGRESLYNPKTTRAAARIANLLGGLQTDLVREIGARSRNAKLRKMQREVALDLRRWAKKVLAPVVTSVGNARDLAEQRMRLAIDGVSVCRGMQDDEEWISASTTQICDEELRTLLSQRLDQHFSIGDTIIEPMMGRGINRGRSVLSIDTLPRLSPSEVVEILHGTVQDEAKPLLRFLESGWRLPEVQPRLARAAQLLDQGAKSLVNFDQNAVGVQTQGYLLVPADLSLKEPFGRRVGRFNRFRGRDPHTLTVLAFTYGIPPNSLNRMDEMFTQYVTHVGDQTRHRAHDRYPLHVFRDAPATFDEPHSPLALSRDDEFLAALLAMGGKSGVVNGSPTQLNIRQFDGTIDALRGDWNLVIELSEELVRLAIRSPEHAADILAVKALSALHAVIQQRKNRYQNNGHQRRSSSHSSSDSAEERPSSPSGESAGSGEEE